MRLRTALFLAIVGLIVPGAGSAMIAMPLVLDGIAGSEEATRSIDPVRGAVETIGFIALLFILGSVVLARWLGSVLSAPLDELIAFTRQFAAEPRSRAAVRGTVEVRALGTALNEMAAEIEAARRSLVEKQRLQKELEIATKIQTAVLPIAPELPGLEIGARIVSAEEVGGDYYDVRPASDGGWIGIGDVTGHGVHAGLVMLMTQAAIAALSSEETESPREVLVRLNALMHEAIRNRLHLDDHVTLNLIRYREDGRFVVAGQHEVLLVLRAGAPSCEQIETSGMWIGALPDISAFTTDTELSLGPGDLLVLHTDGIVEARNATGRHFGIDALARTIEQHRGQPVEEICDEVVRSVRAFMSRQRDDMAIVVIRYVGLRAEAASERSVTAGGARA
jgi:serine phosphatase RsbU (regulator of sigma subunit)